MVMSMLLLLLLLLRPVAARGEQKGQCRCWGDGDALAGVHSAAPGKLPLYIPAWQNEGISRIPLERHDLMMEATWSAEMRRLTWK